MTKRRATVAAAVVLAALLGLLARKSRDGSPNPAPATSPTLGTASTVATTTTTPAPASNASAPPALPSSGSDDDGAARPQPVPLPPGANPPPLDGKKSEPAPPQKDFTPSEVIAKREADLKLLDETKARLEKDLATAKAAKDATTAHDLEVRIARLTDLRKKRGTELDQLKGSAQ